MKHMICLCFAVMFIICAALSASAFTMQSSRTYRSADDTGAYVVRVNGSHADITCYASRTLSAGLDLYHPVSAVCAYRGKVVLFCDDSINNQLIVYVYTLDTDMLDSFAVYGAKLYGGTQFCCDNSAVYIENSRDNKELTAYSYSGTLMERYRFRDEITSAFGGYHGGVYVVGGETLYKLSNGGFSAVSGDPVSPPLFPADAGVLTSVYGKAYVLDSDRITHTFDVDSDYHAASACVIGNRLYYPCGSYVNGYDVDSGEKVCYYQLPFSAALLYAEGGNVVAVGDSSVTTVGLGDFIELCAFADNSGDDPDDSGSNTVVRSFDGNNVSGGTIGTISSDVYHVDPERYYITGIAPGTTVAQFRSNMRYDGYSAAVYRDNTVRKSGNVGTAMTAVFTSDNGSVTYELGVIGDITGEGSRNKRDLYLLLDYLIDAADFNGVYTAAADVSGDGRIDVVDAAILSGMTE